MSGKRWTEAETLQLIDQRTNNRSLKGLFKSLDRSNTAIRNKSIRMGYRGSGEHIGRWWQEETRNRLVLLWNSNKSVKEIAEEMDMSIHAIYAKAKRMGLKRGRRK